MARVAVAMSQTTTSASQLASASRRRRRTEAGSLGKLVGSSCCTEIKKCKSED